MYSPSAVPSMTYGWSSPMVFHPLAARGLLPLRPLMAPLARSSPDRLVRTQTRRESTFRREANPAWMESIWLPVSNWSFSLGRYMAPETHVSLLLLEKPSVPDVFTSPSTYPTLILVDCALRFNEVARKRKLESMICFMFLSFMNQSVGLMP